jgi:non-ribosomal peptide synthetase component F
MSTSEGLNGPASSLLNGKQSGAQTQPNEFTNTTSSPASPQDLSSIWKWNFAVPPSVEGCVHDVIKDFVARQPEALAVCAWDGNFTYAQLDALANHVARKIIQLGTPPKSSVPILLSKSRWTPVAMLAVIKSGCSAIALDATQPDARLRSIAQQARPSIIVSSSALSLRATQLLDVPLLALDDTLLDAIDQPEGVFSELPNASPSDIVYISFTSYVVYNLLLFKTKVQPSPNQSSKHIQSPVFLHSLAKS